MRPGRRSFLISWLITSCLLSTVPIVLGYYWGRFQGEKTRLGWFLGPSLVAAHPLDEGVVLTAADLEVKVAPQVFTSDSAVPVEERESLTGKKLLVRLAAGDLVTRWMLEGAAPQATCPDRVRSEAERLGVLQVPEIRALLSSVSPEAPHGQ